MSQIPNDPPTDPELPRLPPQTLNYAVSRPSRKRIATTVLGIIAIVLGALGMVVSGLNAVGMMAGIDSMIPSLGGVSKGLIWTDAVFQLMCKIGLLSIGILMLRRSSSARLIAVLALLTSLISSGIAITVVQKMTFPTPMDGKAAIVGAIAIIVLAIALYLSLIIYMMTQATREEFEAVNESRGSSIAGTGYDSSPPAMG